MSAVLLIGGGNIKRFVRNRSFYVVAFVAPFAIMAALSATIGAALGGEFRPSIVIADQIGGTSLDSLVTNLRAAGFDDLATVPTESAARQRIENGEAAAAIIFPNSLVDPSTTDAAIVVLSDAEAGLAGDVATVIAEQSARNFDTVRVLRALEAPVDDLTGPLELVTSGEIESRVLTDGTYFAVGMSAYFAFFAASGYVATLHRERRQATLARMLVAPIDRFAPLIGKGLASAAVSLISFTALVISSTVLLGADWGSLLGVAMVGVALCFAAVGVSMAIVALTRSEESAAQVGIVVSTAWAVFGGVFLEVPSTGPLSAAARLSPFRWAFEAIGLNAGAGTLGEVFARAAAIAGFGVIGIAVVVARRDELGRI